MAEHRLGPGQTITYRTKTSGRVIVRESADRREYLAECDGCGEPHRGIAPGELTRISEWARDHAAVCTALPSHWLDSHAAAWRVGHDAELLLDELRPTTPHEERAALLAEADIRARLAAVYAELTWPQP